MKIETKFDVGDRVCIINKTYNYKNDPCLVCNESKSIELKNGLKLECPVCHGNGYKRISTVVYEVRESKATITRISFQACGCNNGQTVYAINLDDNARYENELFKTLKEAQKECDRLNKLEEYK